MKTQFSPHKCDCTENANTGVENTPTVPLNGNLINLSKKCSAIKIDIMILFTDNNHKVEGDFSMSFGFK